MTLQILILIADDEPHVLRALSFVLQREGFSIDVASNGEEALRKIREKRPMVAFLDIVMPKMTGLELCREIRSDPETKGIHIIILTAKGQELDRQNCMSAGADEYLTKPFSPKEVVERVRKLFPKVKA
jgi:two-component system, OmpR family, alkaline phosphatase synthesis response regulator PhoP